MKQSTIEERDRTNVERKVIGEGQRLSYEFKKKRDIFSVKNNKNLIISKFMLMRFILVDLGDRDI